jgi:hypothetical protein
MAHFPRFCDLLNPLNFDKTGWFTWVFLSIYDCYWDFLAQNGGAAGSLGRDTAVLEKIC